MANHEEQCNCDQALELRKLLVEAMKWIEYLDDLVDDGESFAQIDEGVGKFQRRLKEHLANKKPKSPT